MVEYAHHVPCSPLMSINLSSVLLSSCEMHHVEDVKDTLHRGVVSEQQRIGQTCDTSVAHMCLILAAEPFSALKGCITNVA